MLRKSDYRVHEVVPVTHLIRTTSRGEKPSALVIASINQSALQAHYTQILSNDSLTTFTASSNGISPSSGTKGSTIIGPV